MNDFPSISGERLIKALKKQGFVVIRVREATIYCGARMDAARSCRFIMERRSVLACLRRFYATATYYAEHEVFDSS